MHCERVPLIGENQDIIQVNKIELIEPVTERHSQPLENCGVRTKGITRFS